MSGKQLQACRLGPHSLSWGLSRDGGGYCRRSRSSRLQAMALVGLVGTMWRLPAALPHPPVASMLPLVQGWLTQALWRPFCGLHLLGLARGCV